jgi:hypothetical protein
MPQVELVEAKQRKLDEQTRLAQKMNTILTCEGGLNEVSTQMRRDIKMCIDVAKRPGYRKYYQPPEESIALVQNNELNKLTKKIVIIQGELDSLDLNLKAARKQSSVPVEIAPAQLNSLKQWFARHGEPGPAPPSYMSSFDKGRKIYGGTSHHPAFRSQSSTMKVGIMTR